MAEAVQGFSAAQSGVVETDDAQADLLEMGRAYRRWALLYPSLYAVMFEDILGPSPQHDRLPDSPMIGMKPMTDALERASAAGVLGAKDLMLAAISIWAGVHGFVSLEIAQWSSSPRRDRDALYEEHLRAVSTMWTR